MNINALQRGTALHKRLTTYTSTLEKIRSARYQSDMSMGQSSFEVDASLIDEEAYEHLHQVYIDALNERKEKLQAEFDAL